jgi:hypothetical protein
MIYQDLEPFLSAARLNRYLVACDMDHEKALVLYHENLQLCAQFSILLNLLEVSLRNNLNNSLTDYFQNDHWIITQKTGFMMDPSLQSSQYFLKREIEKTERKLRAAGKIIKPGTIISNQNFGFWTAFFDNHHYRLVQGAPIKAFPYKPNTINRSELSIRLNQIRKFRNRIYHNEPICFHGQRIEFIMARQNLAVISDLLQWINPILLVQPVKLFDIDWFLQRLEYRYNLSPYTAEYYQRLDAIGSTLPSQ